MATKAVNIKMNESRIMDIKNVANVFHMTMTDVITEALDEYLAKMKKDPFYRLTANIQDASDEEAAEILDALDAMQDDEMHISSSKTFQQ